MGLIMVQDHGEETAPAASFAGVDAGEALNLAGLSGRQGRLRAELATLDFAEVATRLAGLLTRPDNQPASFRIEALVHLAAVHCAGDGVPAPARFDEWLNVAMLADPIGAGGDPAEDVFATVVPSWRGDLRIFEGAWKDSGAALEDTMAAALQLRERPWAEDALLRVTALLSLSDEMARRADVSRYATSDGAARARVDVDGRTLEGARAVVVFTVEDLIRLRASPRALAAFRFDRAGSTSVAAETLGHTALERRPLVAHAGGIFVALPTALSAAARRYLLEAAWEAGDLPDLAAELARLQTGRVFHLGLRGWDIRASRSPEGIAPGARAMVGRFDDGSPALVVVVDDDLEEVLDTGLQGVQMVDGDVEGALERLERGLAAAPDYRRGLTVVVHGGVGRGFGMTFGEAPSQWRRVALALEDFLCLAWDHRLSAARAWKLLGYEEGLPEKGVSLANPNGFLNYYGYLLGTGFEHVPADMAAPAVLALTNDCVAPFRKRMRADLDRHTEKGSEGAWVEVQRRSNGVFFREVSRLPQYAATAAVGSGRLMACVRTPVRPWWMVLDQRIRNPEGSDLAFRVWDAAQNWLVRLAPRLEATLPGIPDGPVTVRLELPDIEAWGADTVYSDQVARRPDVDVDAGVVRVACPIACLRAFTRSTNVGERWLIAAVALGAARLAGATHGEEWADAEARQATRSEAARFVHVFMAQDLREQVRAGAELPPVRFVPEEDLGWVRLGLAREAGRGSPGRVPDGEAKDLLRIAVVRLWERIRARLGSLERVGVLTRALANHEAVDADRAAWRRSAAALLALHEDTADVVDAAGDREGRRASTGLACRVVAEMALCACPVGTGAACADVDLDLLMADVTALLECAAQSDALHYRLAAAPVEVAPNGSFVFDGTFLDDVQIPYVAAHNERAFRDAADEYATALRNVAPENKAAPELDPAFLSAVQAEFGVSLEGMHRLASDFAASAVEARSTFVVLSRSEVLGRLAQADDSCDAERAYDALTLRPRERWDDRMSEGASPKDWEPWRYGRRLSLVRRPLLQVDIGADPRVLAFPSLLEHAVRRFCGLVYGRLSPAMFDTAAMDRWLGTAVDRLGHAFNATVAAAIRDLGWNAQPEVKATRLGGPSRLGDVDVLAWSPRTGVVFAIECKRLLAALTVGEIGARLLDYATLGKRNGKRTPIQKHLDRVAFLRSASRDLASYTGIPAERMVLRSALVTDGLVPMQFLSRMRELVDEACDVRLLGRTFANPEPD